MALFMNQSKGFPTIVPPVKTAYQYRIVTDLDAFRALQPQWDGFLKKAGVQNLCMTHGFLAQWLRHFLPDQILVVIVEDADGNWIGLAPFQINRSRTGLSHKFLRHLQWIGTQPTVFDWMQIAVHPKSDETMVIQQIAQALQQAKWDVLDLQFVLVKTQLQILADALNLHSDVEPSICESTCIPYVPLQSTEEEYEKTRRKKTRLEVNRHQNNIKKSFSEPLQLEFKAFTPETKPFLEQFFNRHIQYWAERGSRSDFKRYPVLKEFYQSLLAEAPHAEQNNQAHLVFSVLTLGETALSFHFGFWQGERYLAHITSYNPDFKKHGPGTVHMDKLIFKMLERQSVEFEFGRGDEAYKKLWAEHQKPLWNLCLHRTAWSRALWQVDVWLKKRLGKVTS